MSRSIHPRLPAYLNGRTRSHQVGSHDGGSGSLHWAGRGHALHCAIIAVDVTGFADPLRDLDVQEFIRDSLYRMLAESFDESGVPWDGCYHEDRGDGVLIVVPPGAPTAVLIDPLVELLFTKLRFHNKVASDIAQIRLRVALHLGHVYFDDHGVVGRAVNHTFRLLEAPAFKSALGAGPADLGLVASDYVYDDLICDGPGLIDPATYRSIAAVVKETEARAWMYLPAGGAPPFRGREPHRAGNGAPQQLVGTLTAR